MNIKVCELLGSLRNEDKRYFTAQGASESAE